MTVPPDTLWHDEVGRPDGPLVVLIHGSMDRSTGMLKLGRQLAGSARVLRYDRRGYGRSAPHPGPHTIDHQVADLVHLLAGRQAVLVGHSYGGNVALAVAARHPQSVSAVAIYETPLSWEPWWPGSTAGSEAVAAAGDPADAAERFMRRLIGDERWEALPQRTRDTRKVEGAAMVAELSDLRRRAPWRADEIVHPVIAGYGTLGSAHHRRGMRHVADSVATARVVELEGCRHDAPLSHPALFAELLVEPLLSEARRA
ncbi:MAG: alpha/beta hydrolase fold protein [Acidimicrobiaceae bacterium]|nr:MAG: alpha/beta hydrolase fold protein [Acidimicrobiaceae bacterium]